MRYQKRTVRLLLIRMLVWQKKKKGANVDLGKQSRTPDS